MAAEKPSGRNAVTDDPGLVAMARQVIDASRFSCWAQRQHAAMAESKEGT